jgi:hypothetical protein
MPITVEVPDNDSITFADAATWHVDADRNLHLRSGGDNKQVATFAPGAWLSAHHAEAQA